MKKIITVFIIACSLFATAEAQNTPFPTTTSTNAVGIGTTTPFARFHVFDGNSTTLGSGVLFQGEIGNTPVAGAGSRLMWIPSKAAFRAGRVSNFMTYQGTTNNIGQGSDYWDDSNIGLYSFASGLSNKSSGYASSSLGLFNRAEGDFSASIGNGNLTLFSGYAFGESNDVQANEFSIALGKNNTINARGYALGSSNTVNNQNGTAIGTNNLVNTNNSTAIGSDLVTASNDVMVFGNENLGLTNSNVAFEFGIGNGSPKNVLTMYDNGDVQLNEISGTGDYLAIDNVGVLSRVDIAPQLWQENTATEIFYEQDVTMGQVSLNRPSNTKLWVDGSGQLNELRVQNVLNSASNDPSQNMSFRNYDNRSMFLWGGDNLVGNQLEFRFKSDFGTGQPWNSPDGDLALTIFPNGNVKGGATNGALRVATNSGYVEVGPQDVNLCHFNTNLPKFYFNKSLVIDGGILSSHNNQDLKLQTNGTTRMTFLNSNGYVGIGTNSPNHLLQVGGDGITSGNHTDAIATFDGKIVAKTMITTLSGWADFVFEEDYKLMPLDELKIYIESNRHLPNIPTTEEVLEDGIELGDINVKLLQKIEELTLYILDLEQRMEELEVKSTIR